MIDTRSPARAVGRRRVLAAGLAATGAVLVGCGSPGPSPSAGTSSSPVAPSPGFAARLDDLERRFAGRVGVAALDTATGRSLGHRADERFLMCSTVKVLIVAAVLRRSLTDPGFLDRRLRWSRADLLSYAPATTPAVDTGLTVAELCDATITLSDNTAANVLSAQVGGPAGLTAFVRSTGDTVTRADRPEPALNDVAGDLDTTTPAAFLPTLQGLTLGTVLPAPERNRLVGWMLATTTGAAQIRAGTPAGWAVADKTGSGASGEIHDVGLVRPPGRAPVVLAVYTAPTDPANESGRATVAAATTEVLRELGLTS